LNGCSVFDSWACRRDRALICYTSGLENIDSLFSGYERIDRKQKWEKWDTLNIGIEKI
jgi:hypothetical protein